MTAHPDDQPLPLAWPRRDLAWAVLLDRLVNSDPIPWPLLARAARAAAVDAAGGACQHDDRLRLVADLCAFAPDLDEWAWWIA